MQNSEKSNALKYILLEVGLVILFLLVAAAVIFNPFGNVLTLPKSKTPPADMTKGVGPDGKITNVTPVAPPESLMVFVNDKNFEPQAASGSAKGTVLTYINNAVGPLTLKFSDNFLPDLQLGPQGSWTSANIIKKGTFTVTVLETGATGTLTLQ